MTGSPNPTPDDSLPHGPGHSRSAAEALDPVERLAAAGRRLKSSTILGVIAWSALVFLAWSQNWFTLAATGRAGDALTIAVPGTIAAPALSALALAGLALSAALAIAGPVIRAILGFLELVLGASVVWSTVSALANPADASQAAVTTATGVAGTGSIEAIVSGSEPMIWPFLALAAGVLMGVTGLSVLVTLRRWPAGGRKYQPVQFAAADGRVAGNPIDLFDAGDVADAEHDEADIDGGVLGASGAHPRNAGASTGTSSGAEAEHPDVNTARTKAVDTWDSLSQGNDPTT